MQREILTFIKANRKEFNRQMFKRWGNRCLVGMPYSMSHRYNPELGCEIVMVWKALDKLGWQSEILTEDLGNSDIEKVWLKYRERFTNKYLGPRVLRRNGRFPQEQRTRAIKELLARGFMHEYDANIDKRKWFIECHIAPLVWHEDFEDQKDAINILNKFGIPGYTGIKTLKKQ